MTGRALMRSGRREAKADEVRSTLDPPLANPTASGVEGWRRRHEGGCDPRQIPPLANPTTPKLALRPQTREAFGMTPSLNI